MMLLAPATLMLGAEWLAWSLLMRLDPRAPIALLAQGLPFLSACWLALVRPARVDLRLVVGVALLQRLPLLWGLPLLSSDAFRYVWDGRVQRAGIDPFRLVPADPALAFLRDGRIFPNINRADYAVTIYPPAAQVLFLAVALLTAGEGGLPALRLAFLALEGLAWLAVLRLLDHAGQPRARLVMLAWHPLAVWEIANNAHVDAGSMALLALGLWAAAAARPALAGAALAVGGLFKPLVLAAGPALWRPRGVRLPVGFAAATIALAAPYLLWSGAGTVASAGLYAREEGIAEGSAFWLLRLIAALGGPAPDQLRWPYLALGAGWLAAVALRPGAATVPAMAGRAVALLFAAVMILSPNYPWYALPLLPLLPLAPAPGSLALTLTGFALYAGPPGAEPAWMLLAHTAAYAPALLLALTARRHRP